MRGLGRIVLGLAAIGVVAVGALPMAVASTNRTADPILAEALAGSTNWTVGPTPSFSLVDQNGHTVTLSSLRGKAVLLTFLDPVCNFDCPLIAQYLKGVDAELGPEARHVQLVAIVANPLYRAPVYMKAFDRQEGLTSLHNWFFLTGSLGQLQQAWERFGVTVSVSPAGAMIAHTDILYVIDPLGRTREILSSNPGPGTSSYESSFSSLLASAAVRALHSA
jgi:cytochrome oxidase Cu insertion factor (SCO1/SenC/PrrC family)